MERRIGRMQGEIDSEQKEKLEAKIEELTKTMEEKNNLLVLLNTQLKQLQVILWVNMYMLRATGVDSQGRGWGRATFFWFYVFKLLKRGKINSNASCCDLDLKTMCYIKAFYYIQ